MNPTSPGAERPAENWRIDNPVGVVEADRATSTAAAPMLAGFSFASAVVLLTAEDKPQWTEPALTCFFLAAAALLFAVQFGNAGLMYSAGPAERLAWLPDPDNVAHVELAKRVQHRDSAVAARFRRRARACYDTGVVLLMVALTVASVPADWNVWRIVVVAVLSVVVVLELLWIVGGRTRLRARWLLPDYKSVGRRLPRPAVPPAADEPQDGEARPDRQAPS
ncbi:hypothetical protein ABZ816_37895 [Actinosynnema sp. NPDC047251]|uniref:hypothetical protein n=1 Tax=Saccharothrix espanaensis TaxID=103731 RepID=UPI0002DC2C2B|nr:hypothetical protein [Saccharothrix espanaensis]